MSPSHKGITPALKRYYERGCVGAVPYCLRHSPPEDTCYDEREQRRRRKMRSHSSVVCGAAAQPLSQYHRIFDLTLKHYLFKINSS